MSVKVLVGKPFLEIIRTVLRNKHDLVIKAANKDGGLKTMVFGSTDMHLMRKCPCPVWVVQPTHQKKYARIMAAVDLDPVDKKRSKLSVKIMELAASLAHLLGSELHVVHAWNLSSEKMLVMRGGLGHGDVEGLARSLRAEHARWLDELVNTCVPGTPASRIHLLKHAAGVLIPQAVKREKIDLVVMGTVGRAGIAGLLIGNTAEKILHQVECSVMTLKPDGFVSPVT